MPPVADHSRYALFLQALTSGHSQKDLFSGQLPGFSQFTKDQIKTTVRTLKHNGFMIIDPHFSDLRPGGTGIMYSLTDKGKSFLANFERVSQQTVGALSRPVGTVGHDTHSERINDTVYGGLSCLTMKCQIRSMFSRTPPWTKTRQLRGIECRYMSQEISIEGVKVTVSIQESGGGMSGSTSNSLIFRACVHPSLTLEPDEAERKGRTAIERIHAWWMREYACLLSGLEDKNSQYLSIKHAFFHDEVARKLSMNGIVIQGPIGVDGTPQEGTLHISDSQTATNYKRYREELIGHVVSAADAGSALSALQTDVANLIQSHAELLKEIEALVQSINALSNDIRSLTALLSKRPWETKQVPSPSLAMNGE
jgi:hypothetical protein